MSIYDEYPDLSMDQYTAELLKRIDHRFSSGPVPIEGQYTRGNPGQISVIEGVGFGLSVVSTRALMGFAIKETLMMPARGIEVVPIGPGKSQQEGIAYAYVASDTVHYPGKPYVDFVLGLF
jgi:hypothetical protein